MRNVVSKVSVDIDAGKISDKIIRILAEQRYNEELRKWNNLFEKYGEPQYKMPTREELYNEIKSNIDAE